jgi:SAM-dependent methyltransferase
MADDAARRVSGTEGYAESADALAEQYESISFADSHRPILHLMPTTPGQVLDIGAGTGRDAAALAALGHRVLAVEPTPELRAHGQRLHRSAPITWIDDALPELAKVHERGERFDLIMLTAVWMHLDAAQRQRAMGRVAGLLRPSGLMALSLRHGPVPTGRRMFEVSAAETCALAGESGLETVHQSERGDRLGRPGVWWSILAFRGSVSPR